MAIEGLIEDADDFMGNVILTGVITACEAYNFEHAFFALMDSKDQAFKVAVNEVGKGNLYANFIEYFCNEFEIPEEANYYDIPINDVSEILSLTVDSVRSKIKNKKDKVENGTVITEESEGLTATNPDKVKGRTGYRILTTDVMRSCKKAGQYERLLKYLMNTAENDIVYAFANFIVDCGNELPAELNKKLLNLVAGFAYGLYLKGDNDFSVEELPKEEIPFTGKTYADKYAEYEMIQKKYSRLAIFDKFYADAAKNLSDTGQELWKRERDLLKGDKARLKYENSNLEIEKIELKIELAKREGDKKLVKKLLKERKAEIEKNSELYAEVMLLGDVDLQDQEADLTQEAMERVDASDDVARS